jgi:hypothetical protein
VLLVGKCAVCLPCVQAFYNSTRGRRTAPCAVWLNRGVTTPPRATPLAVLVAACGAGVQGAGYRTGQVRIEGSEITEAEAPPVPLWPPPPALLPATFDSFRRFARAGACFLLGRTTYTPIVEQRVKQGFLSREWKLLEFPPFGCPA